MLETKKKKFIGIIIGIIILTLGIIYIMQNGEDKYFNFETEIENNKNFVNENKALDYQEEQDEVKTNEIIVHIAGQVVNPGVISLKEGARIIDAISEAGGITDEADINKINLAYVLADAQKIYIPSVNEKEDINYVSDKSGQASSYINGGNEDGSRTKEKVMVNINTASEAELQKIPGVGQTIAARIVAYRKENGKFVIIEDIQKVSGIGSSKFNSIKEYICVK